MMFNLIRVILENCFFSQNATGDVFCSHSEKQIFSLIDYRLASLKNYPGNFISLSEFHSAFAYSLIPRFQNEITHFLNILGKGSDYVFLSR